VRSLDSVICYAGNLPKPTKNNSVIISNRVVSIVKKDYDAKNINMYVAYDLKTKKLIHGEPTMEELVSFLVGKEKDIALTFGTTNQTLF
jgi:formaldehyde-activating enzyme involved in methanogenesis